VIKRYLKELRLGWNEGLTNESISGKEIGFSIKEPKLSVALLKKIIYLNKFVLVMQCDEAE